MEGYDEVDGGRPARGRRVAVAVGCCALMIGGAAVVSSLSRGSAPGAALLKAQKESAKATAEKTHLARLNSCMDPESGPVLDGRDVVAYWTMSVDSDSSVVGSADHSALYAGYNFYFASEQNKDLFTADPDKYLPQYGGFCSYGVAWETWWSANDFDAQGDPDRWSIWEDKLYFFRGREPKSWFMAKVSDSVYRGDLVWNKWYNNTARFDTDCFYYAENDDA